MQTRSEYSKCEMCDEELPSAIYLEQQDYMLLLALARSQNKEWLMTCNFNEETGYIKLAETAYYPKQEVTAASCEAKEEAPGNCLIHSHVDMGAFHSGGEKGDTHYRNGFVVSLVINRKGEMYATRKFSLPCGGFHNKEMIVEVEHDTYDKDVVDDHIARLKDSITEKVYTTTTTKTRYDSRHWSDDRYNYDSRHTDHLAFKGTCLKCGKEAYLVTSLFPKVHHKFCYGCHDSLDYSQMESLVDGKTTSKEEEEAEKECMACGSKDFPLYRTKHWPELSEKFCKACWNDLDLDELRAYSKYEGVA